MCRLSKVFISQKGEERWWLWNSFIFSEETSSCGARFGKEFVETLKFDIFAATGGDATSSSPHGKTFLFIYVIVAQLKQDYYTANK